MKKALYVLALMLVIASVSVLADYKCYPQLTKVYTNNCMRNFDYVADAGINPDIDINVGTYSNNLVRAQVKDDNSFLVYAYSGYAHALVPVYGFRTTMTGNVKTHLFYLPAKVSKYAPLVSAGKGEIEFKVVPMYSGNVDVDEVEVISGFMQQKSPYFLVLN